MKVLMKKFQHKYLKVPRRKTHGISSSFSIFNMRVYNKNTKDDALSKFSIFALCSITRILLGENVTALTLQRKLTTHIKFNIFGKK